MDARLESRDRRWSTMAVWLGRARDHIVGAVFDVRTLAEGWARPGPWLSRIAEAHVRNHLRRNRTSRLLRYNPLRTVIATLGRRPILCLAIFMLIYAGVAVMTWLSPPISWGPQVPLSAGDYFRDFQTINLALMGAQATLLGLVYPLVIALVSLLFQETTARGARLNAYFKETEATAVGGTALLFIAWVALQSLFYGQVPVKVIAAATVVNTIWFMGNLVGLAFFVRTSLDFVRPAGRLRMLESYLANTAWPAQFRSMVRDNRLRGAEDYGYLERPPAVGLVGLVNPYGFDPPIASRALSRPRVLVDVSFGRLNAIIRNLHRKAARGWPTPTLTFTPTVDLAYPEGKVVLASGTGALSGAEYRVLEHAYRFGPPSRALPSSLTQELLTELIASVEAQFEAGNYEEFKARLDEVMDIHVRLYELAMSPREPGVALFNYAKLEDGWRSLGLEWVRTYRSLLLRAGDQIERAPRFFESLVHLPGRIHRRIWKVAPPDARADLFDLAAMPVLALLDRADKERADAMASGTTEHGVFSLQGASAGRYQRFWINYVGAWETFGEALGAVARDDREPAGWDDLRALIKDLFRHLSDTALLVARAAQVGEAQSTGWTADLLMMWRNRTIRRLGEAQGDWSLQRPLLTLTHADLDWAAIEAAPLSLQNQPKVPAAVFGAIMDNAWFDTVVMTLANMLAKCPDPVSGTIPDSGAARAAVALYHQRSFDPGASDHGQGRSVEIAGLLRSLLRRADRATGYGAEIDAITERIDRLKGPNYVSGRVYGWSGFEAGEDAFADPQIVLLASAISPSLGRRSEVNIGDDSRRLLLPDEDARRRRILDHLWDFIQRAENVDLSRTRALLSLLLERPLDEAETRARIAAVKALLEACRGVIQAERLVMLQTATFDPARIRAVETVITDAALEVATFPLNLFRQVGRLGGPLPRFPLQRLGVRRGHYTTPLFEDSFTDDDAHMGEVYAPRITARVLYDALQRGAATRRSPRTPGGWWRAVKQGVEAVRAAGMTPLIIRGARNEPSWFIDWLYDATGDLRPVDMELERRDGYGDGYDFHLNEVPIFSNPGADDATWVVAREMFARVDFEVFDNGQVVRAALAIDPADPWRAVLSCEFGRQLTLEEAPLWRIPHGPIRGNART